MIHYPNMLQPPSLLASLILTIGLSSTPIFSAPANRTAPDILPDTTVVYVELSNPKDLIHFVEESRLRKNLDDSGMSGLLTANRQYAEFLALVKVIEQQAGLKWRPTLVCIWPLTGPPWARRCS
jgi:hypothetical protein